MRRKFIHRPFSRHFSLWLIVSFLGMNLSWTVPAGAQTVPGLLGLPVPGAMVATSTAFEPVLIKGLTVHPEDPFHFDFIVDPGDSDLGEQEIKTASDKLIKYFLSTLTIPEEDQWVNLSPFESDRIIPEQFGNTEMGRDLLAQDYLLKQITSSLIYPESDLGKLFWDKIYSKAYQMFGTTDVPVNTFNKVWIVPDTAVVYEHNQTAVVVGSRLKVMLEQDYLALNRNQDQKRFALSSVGTPEQQTVNEMSSSIVREVVIPVLQQEVNEGRNFALLRQIYQSMILATWYKKRLKESLLSRVYVDRNKIKGVDVTDKAVKDKIYERYLQAYQKGVYNFIREDYDRYSGEVLPRKYFSGGFGMKTLPRAIRTILDPEALGPAEALNLKNLIHHSPQAFQVAAQVVQPGLRADRAMLSEGEAVDHIRRVLQLTGDQFLVEVLQNSFGDTEFPDPAVRESLEALEHSIGPGHLPDYFEPLDADARERGLIPGDLYRTQNALGVVLHSWSPADPFYRVALYRSPGEFHSPGAKGKVSAVQFTRPALFSLRGAGFWRLKNEESGKALRQSLETRFQGRRAFSELRDLAEMMRSLGLPSETVRIRGTKQELFDGDYRVEFHFEHFGQDRIPDMKDMADQMRAHAESMKKVSKINFGTLPVEDLGFLEPFAETLEEISFAGSPTIRWRYLRELKSGPLSRVRIFDAGGRAVTGADESPTGDGEDRKKREEDFLKVLDFLEALHVSESVLQNDGVLDLSAEDLKSMRSVFMNPGMLAGVDIIKEVVLGGSPVPLNAFAWAKVKEFTFKNVKEGAVDIRPLFGHSTVRQLWFEKANIVDQDQIKEFFQRMPFGSRSEAVVRYNGSIYTYDSFAFTDEDSPSADNRPHAKVVSLLDRRKDNAMLSEGDTKQAVLAVRQFMRNVVSGSGVRVQHLIDDALGRPRGWQEAGLVESLKEVIRAGQEYGWLEDIKDQPTQRGDLLVLNEMVGVALGNLPESRGRFWAVSLTHPGEEAVTYIDEDKLDADEKALRFKDASLRQLFAREFSGPAQTPAGVQMLRGLGAIIYGAGLKKKGLDMKILGTVSPEDIEAGDFSVGLDLRTLEDNPAVKAAFLNDLFSYPSSWEGRGRVSRITLGPVGVEEDLTFLTRFPNLKEVDFAEEAELSSVMRAVERFAKKEPAFRGKVTFTGVDERSGDGLSAGDGDTGEARLTEAEAVDNIRRILSLTKDKFMEKVWQQTFKNFSNPVVRDSLEVLERSVRSGELPDYLEPLDARARIEELRPGDLYQTPRSFGVILNSLSPPEEPAYWVAVYRRPGALDPSGSKAKVSVEPYGPWTLFSMPITGTRFWRLKNDEAREALRLSLESRFQERSAFSEFQDLSGIMKDLGFPPQVLEIVGTEQEILAGNYRVRLHFEYLNLKPDQIPDMNDMARRMKVKAAAMKKVSKINFGTLPVEDLGFLEPFAESLEEVSFINSPTIRWRYLRTLKSGPLSRVRIIDAGGREVTAPSESPDGENDLQKAVRQKRERDHLAVLDFLEGLRVSESVLQNGGILNFSRYDPKFFTGALKYSQFLRGVDVIKGVALERSPAPLSSFALATGIESFVFKDMPHGSVDISPLIGHPSVKKLRFINAHILDMEQIKAFFQKMPPGNRSGAEVEYNLAGYEKKIYTYENFVASGEDSPSSDNRPSAKVVPLFPGRGDKAMLSEGDAGKAALIVQKFMQNVLSSPEVWAEVLIKEALGGDPGSKAAELVTSLKAVIAAGQEYGWLEEVKEQPTQRGDLLVLGDGMVGVALGELPEGGGRIRAVTSTFAGRQVIRYEEESGLKPHEKAWRFDFAREESRALKGIVQQRGSFRPAPAAPEAIRRLRAMSALIYGLEGDLSLRILDARSREGIEAGEFSLGLDLRGLELNSDVKRMFLDSLSGRPDWEGWGMVSRITLGRIRAAEDLAFLKQFPDLREVDVSDADLEAIRPEIRRFRMKNPEFDNVVFIGVDTAPDDRSASRAGTGTDEKMAGFVEGAREMIYHERWDRLLRNVLARALGAEAGDEYADPGIREAAEDMRAAVGSSEWESRAELVNREKLDGLFGEKEGASGGPASVYETVGEHSRPPSRGDIYVSDDSIGVMVTTSLPNRPDPEVVEYVTKEGTPRFRHRVLDLKSLYSSGSPGRIWRLHDSNQANSIRNTSRVNPLKKTPVWGEELQALGNMLAGLDLPEETLRVTGVNDRPLTEAELFKGHFRVELDFDVLEEGQHELTKRESPALKMLTDFIKSHPEAMQKVSKITFGKLPLTDLDFLEGFAEYPSLEEISFRNSPTVRLHQLKPWKQGVLAGLRIIDAGGAGVTADEIPPESPATATEQSTTVIPFSGRKDQDKALLSEKGGIDLNPEALDLDIRSDGTAMELPSDPAQLEQMDIEGLVPVIINVVPATNLQMLLGYTEETAVPGKA